MVFNQSSSFRIKGWVEERSIVKKNGQVWNKIGAWLLVAFLAISLVGCGANKTENAPEVANNAAQEEQSTPVEAAQTVYPLTLKDSTGTDVVFEKAPERITTIAPSETEVVYAIGAGDKVFGVDEYSDYPEEAKTKTKVGDMNINVEALLATKPDVVFAHSGMQSKTIEELRKLNIKVFASDPKTLDEVMTKIEAVGQIMNLQDGAAKVTDLMSTELKQVTDALQGVPAKKVYMEFSPGWTVGSGEYMNELVTLAGGDNVSKEQTGWFEVDPENVIKANPEVIIYAQDGGDLGKSLVEGIEKRPGFDQIDAVKNKQMFGVDNNSISRVGPRLTKVLLEMAKAIHPEQVK